jgi:transketolase
VTTSPTSTTSDRATSASDRALEQRCIDVIRGLALDAPERAHSGHSGTAMALAPLAHVLFTRILRYDPKEPSWADRDRFVLSNGHASILLYSMLYLTGYGLELDDLRAFRQWGSRTPGHPEVHHTAGVEVTTGPLGQGLANAVGMAIAERFVRSHFGPQACDHRTYVIAGDGCLMEGISHEAASLAGHLGLGRLTCVYDDNHITIDGATELAYSDDVAARFSAYGWHVERLGETANDLDELEAALARASEVSDRPSLLMLRSHIGWPSPHLTDTAKAHGDPFGAAEIAATKILLGLPQDREFYVPDDVLEFYRGVAAERARRWRTAERGDGVAVADRPAYAAAQAGTGLAGWVDNLPSFEVGSTLATRRAVNACLNAVAPSLPGLLAGSADLTGNTGVALSGAEVQAASSPGGRQLHYGIREHAMAAIMNGMALHGGVLPIGGTFFVFSDYLRPSLRLAALSGAHVLFSFTHDSIGLGEDGPTHQPIEQLASLRAMPGLRVIRPADANETAGALHAAIDLGGPTALVLSRQDLPVLAETAANRIANVARGGYELARLSGERAGAAPTPDVDRDGRATPSLILIGTGSEVHLCLDAGRTLAAEDGITVSVVSLPSWECFAEQDRVWQDEVLPAGVPRLAVEAASPFGWERYADEVIGIDTFGASAPSAVNFEKFGFTVDAVVDRARALLGSDRVRRR